MLKRSHENMAQLSVSNYIQDYYPSPAIKVFTNSQLLPKRGIQNELAF